MHDRIKQLVKQAGGHISMRNLASNPVQHIESVELWDDRIEKFAELIVNECADIAQQHNKSPVKSIYAVGHVIREHFGVE